MIALGRVLIGLCMGALIAAVWLPEHLWQLAFTAAVLFIAGGVILGQRS